MSLFTDGPLVALLLDRGLTLQSHAAAVLALFGPVAALFVLVRLYRAVLGAYQDEPTSQVLVRLARPVGLAALGIVLLQGHVHIALSPADADPPVAWGDLPGVQHDPAYEGLRQPSRGLPSFAIVTGLSQEVANRFVKAFQGALSAPSPAERASFVRSLVHWNQRTLTEADGGEAVLRALVALDTHCATEAPVAPVPGTALEDFFEPRHEPAYAGGPTIDCRALLAELRTATERAVAANYADGAAHPQLMGLPAIRANLMSAAERTFGVKSEAELFQFHKKVVVENTIRAFAARLGGSDSRNLRRKTLATFTDDEASGAAESFVDGSLPWLSEALTVGLTQVLGEQAALQVQKGEAAAAFNQQADLYKVTRGFFLIAFAVLFPFCAFGLCCGSTWGVTRWLLGWTILQLYPVVAVLVHEVAAGFASWQQLAVDPSFAWLGEDTLTLGAVSLLKGLTLRVQTVYLTAEKGLFGWQCLALLPFGIRDLGRTATGVQTLGNRALLAAGIAAAGLLRLGQVSVPAPPDNPTPTPRPEPSTGLVRSPRGPIGGVRGHGGEWTVVGYPGGPTPPQLPGPPAGGPSGPPPAASPPRLPGPVTGGGSGGAAVASVLAASPPRDVVDAAALPAPAPAPARPEAKVAPSLRSRRRRLGRGDA